MFRLQGDRYLKQKVPIVLSFLANGVLALGSTKAAPESFRMPVDSDVFASLKMRLDRGSYTLEVMDEAEACCAAVEGLPTANRSRCSVRLQLLR